MSLNHPLRRFRPFFFSYCFYSRPARDDTLAFFGVNSSQCGKRSGRGRKKQRADGLFVFPGLWLPPAASLITTGSELRVNREDGGSRYGAGARRESRAPADSRSRIYIAPSGCSLQAVITHRLALVRRWGMSYNTHDKACHIKNGVK